MTAPGAAGRTVRRGAGRGEEGAVMTPQRDNVIRERAQRAYEFAVAELARTEEPTINYGASDWEEQRAQQKAWHGTAAEYAQLREYRSWLYDVKHDAEYRRRHPIVRLIRRSRNIGRVEHGQYGEDTPEARFHWHWQNLDEDRRGPDRSPSWGVLGLPSLSHEGRAWFDWYLRASDQTPLKIEVDWAVGPRVHATGVGVGRSGGGTLTLHAAIRPLFSVYVILSHVLPRGESKTYSVSIYPDDLTLHYDLGKPGSGDEWHRDDPLNWMRGCRFLLDDIFGRAEYTREKVGPPAQAIACFPEGQYTLTLQRETMTWRRERWPWAYWRKSVDITLERPPEFQGKGENSWDCGPDAIYGMSSDGHSYEDAVAAYVKAVLRERGKRGHLEPRHRSILAEVRP